MKFIYWVIGILVLAVIALVFIGNVNKPGQYDEFAQCLTDAGFKFYGAYWCPHCIEQKEMFGNSASKLPYVECSLANRAGQTQACISAGITGYPTWGLPSGKKVEGKLSFQELSSLSGCSLNSAG
ncbi:MAG TPA: hypothetical protein VHA12_01250 [Candidatus Nanoarchaeia archaeon]|nr:hypothetical protein [Candidatus Nanoarchaeia archaeon]